MLFYYLLRKNHLILCPSSNTSQLPSMIQRISPLQRHHYITSSHTYQFLKKVIFCSSLQYRSALVATRMRNIQDCDSIGLWDDRMTNVQARFTTKSIKIFVSIKTLIMHIFYQPTHLSYFHLPVSACHLLPLMF